MASWRPVLGFLDHRAVRWPTRKLAANSQRVRMSNWGRPRPEDSKRRLLLAPQSGYVSNFCSLVGAMIEPMVAHCFDSDTCELLTRVQWHAPSLDTSRTRHESPRQLPDGVSKVPGGQLQPSPQPHLAGRPRQRSGVTRSETYTGTFGRVRVHLCSLK